MYLVNKLYLHLYKKSVKYNTMSNFKALGIGELPSTLKGRGFV